MKDSDKLNRLDEFIEEAGSRGVDFAARLRGRRLCCNDPANIVFIPVPVGAGFKLNRRDHFENLKRESKKAQCKICQSRYWASADRKSLIDRA